MPSGRPAGSPFGNLFTLPDGIRLTVGATAVMLPTYEMSKSFLFSALPVVQFAPLSGRGSGGALDIRNLDDLSLSIARINGFEFGPLVGNRLGRSEKDSPLLHGRGDIEGGMVAGAFARFNLGPAFVRSSFHHHVTGTDTCYLGRLTLGASHEVHRGIVVKMIGVMDFASDDYMRAYFGVTQLQSARSGLRVHEPGAGLKSVGVTLGTEYGLGPGWSLLASAGYTRLLSNAAPSPVVETADRLEARLGVSRTFDWRFR